MAPFEIPDSDEEEEPAFHPLAAIEEALGEDAGGGERPDAVRSGSTDPAFFQSVYDEHQEAIRQVSRATKPQAEKMADDPYDIPSSPEVSARKRKTNPRSLNPDESQDQASTPQKHKRRRREDEDVDQVSLVKVPTQDDPSWNDPPASLDDGMPSTLDPLQALPQLQPVAPVAVMDSSGFVPTQDQGPLATGRGGLIKSSGSATNINTPRSLPPSMPLDIATQENTAPKSTEPVWVDSSPDMLTTSMTPRPSRRGRNAASKVNQMTPVVEDGQPDEPEAPVAPPEPKSPSYTSNDEPVAKKPAKAKKQRGRPRKNAAPEPVPEPAPEVIDEPDIINVAANAAPEEPSKETIPEEVPEEAPAQPAATKKPGKKPKKKRGRPKKSDKAVPIADTKPLEEAPPIQGAGQEDEQDVQEHKEPDPDPEPKRAKTPKNKRRDDDSDAFDPEGDTPAQKDKEEEEEETKAAIKTTPAIEPKKALKANGTGPGLTSGNKPIYRVGLSKRSRIAPLLKIVRKD
jgi:hypothetical protein